MVRDVAKPWPSIACKGRGEVDGRFNAVTVTRPDAPQVRLWLLLTVASAAAALLFYLAGVPAALLLGPMLTSIAFACRGVKLSVGRWPFIAAQGVVGALVGRSISPSIVADVLSNWPVMLGFVGGTIVAAAIVGWLLARFTSIGAETAAWGSSPGGASAMVAASAAFGADVRIVAFMQYLRVMLVVLSASTVAKILLGSVPHAAPAAIGDPALPPIAGLATTLIAIGVLCAAATALKIPAGAILLPMLAAAFAAGSGRTAVVLPWWLVAAAYAVIGWFVGLAFTRDVVRYALRTLPILMLSTFLLIVLCAAVGEALRGSIHADPLTAYLATSPGGLDSVAIIALGSGSNVPLVLSIQTLRIFLVLLTGPAIARFISRTAIRRPAGA
jgi:membrane AbrB-like protein